MIGIKKKNDYYKIVLKAGKELERITEINQQVLKDQKRKQRKGVDAMQYEAVILELMSRIKKLEEEVKELKSQQEDNKERKTFSTEGKIYTKTTDEMIDICYTCGKRYHENCSLNPWSLADQVAEKTGMNRNSAFMYICAVKGLIEGTIYKRSVNTNALRKYMSNILSEYGKSGLERAIRAAKLHADYLKSLNKPVDMIESVCKEYRKYL